MPLKATAILVGSYARGDFNLWSDIDVLLISEEFDKNPIGRLETMGVPPGFQVISLTLEEFKKLYAKNEKLLVEAISMGIVLRGDLMLASSTT